MDELILMINWVWRQLKLTMNIKLKRECFRYSIIIRNGWKTSKKISLNIRNRKKKKSRDNSNDSKRSNRKVTSKDKNKKIPQVS